MTDDKGVVLTDSHVGWRVKVKFGDRYLDGTVTSVTSTSVSVWTNQLCLELRVPLVEVTLVGAPLPPEREVSTVTCLEPNPGPIRVKEVKDRTEVKREMEISKRKEESWGIEEIF